MTELVTTEYSNRSPWNRAGVYVGDHNLTSKEAIVKAGLDWEVESQRLFASPDGIAVQEILDHKAIVRKPDQRVLGVVGSRYYPIQNASAFEFMDSLVDEGKIKYHTAGQARGGQVIWLLAKIGDIEIVPEDKVDQYLLLYNTHDGTSSLRVLFTVIRMVCANMARVVLGQGAGEGMYVRHTKNLKERLEQAHEVLGIADTRFADFADFAKRAVATRVTPDMWNDLTLKLIPDPPADSDPSQKILTTRQNARQQLTDLFDHGTGQDIPGVGGSAWAAYNAVVEYANYERGARGDDKQRSRFESSIFSGSARLIDKAVSEIRQLAA
jgi:phage/plasmid-like protein (TIGR03299 family)